MEDDKGKEKIVDFNREEETDDAETDTDDEFDQESHNTFSKNSCAKNRSNKGLVLVRSSNCKKASYSGGSGGGTRYCQVEKCTADLREAKTYHKRHRVCERHAKARAVLVSGILQRFCQQCSRFHEVLEFDNSKRSCRRRLAGHNQRRRKSSATGQGDEKPSVEDSTIGDVCDQLQLR